MTTTYLTAWFLFMAPIVYTAGPNNLICAALGSYATNQHFIRYISVANLTILLMSVSTGFGLNLILTKWPAVSTIITIAGAIFLVYMGIKFIRHSEKPTAMKNNLPGTKDALIINLLNPKGIFGLSIMYNAFLTLPYPKSSQIFILSFLTLIISVSSHLLWWSFGNIILSRYSSQKAIKLQGWIFGGMLFLVAIWMLFQIKEPGV